MLLSVWLLCLCGASCNPHPNLAYAEMAFSHTAGTLFSGAAPAQMFFRSKDQCYVKDYPGRWCFPEGHMYHEVSMNALDPMVRRLIEEALLLGNDADADLNFNSTRFDFVWRVAYHQLIMGVWDANGIYTGRLSPRQLVG